MGACGDIPRNVVGCPLAGMHPDEMFDVRPAIQAIHKHMVGNREFSNLPRKYKMAGRSAAPNSASSPRSTTSR
jgi:sulfite reductase beta subunit-like hemoprotein